MLGCEAWLSSKVVICSVSSYLPSFVLPSKYMQMLVHAHSSPPDRMDTHASFMPRSPRLRLSRFGLARLAYGPLLVSQQCPSRSATDKSPNKVWRLRPIQHVGVMLEAWEPLSLLGNTCPGD